MSGTSTAASSMRTVMSCGAVVSGADADAVIARCRQLNTDRVALARDTLPGFDTTTYSGVPEAGYFLKETVERIGEAGIEVYAVSKPYCMGKDMDVIRNPAAHRREIDDMLATVDVVAGSGIPVMLAVRARRRPGGSRRGRRSLGLLLRPSIVRSWPRRRLRDSNSRTTDAGRHRTRRQEQERPSRTSATRTTAASVCRSGKGRS